MEVQLQDSIEAAIAIDTSAEAVWELVKEPGWFINGGEIGAHKIETSDNFSVIHDPIFGRFEFETIKLEAPRYAVFRSLGGDDWEDPVPNTMIEFWIEPVNAGGVRLRVMQSGFAGFAPDEHARVISTNTQGWIVELEAAKRHLSSE